MVKAWVEQIVIPTYEIGKAEKNPIFLEKRVYQGSSGVVYPYPVIESISDEKTDHTYNAVFIENEYIKVMILPELGGRVQMAYDKIKQRHFIYYNQVIKPALVGLAGPWISGGIEFNWPQHHRPSTFMPVDCLVEAKDEKSKKVSAASALTEAVESEDEITIWVNERERMFHQQGQAGFTLRSGCAYLEIQGKLYNPTETPQTFLWWANPAVAVNDAYQSVFPPDVNAVFDHGKRAVSSFPIATGTYYKMDYSAGVDISNYKNIYVPTSYMVAKSKYNFEGGYENDTRAGMLHVADHHIAPGKKQWTWGNGDFGRAWDRNLTDEDGPYIELMAGVYTENQPDFTWLMPYEEKSFVQYFMPYRELGIVKNASKDFMINIDKTSFKIFATSKQKVQVVLKKSGAEGGISDEMSSGTILYDSVVTITPESILQVPINVSSEDFKRLSLDIIKDGRSVLSWQPEPDEIQPIPDAAEAALRPEEIKTTEQLFLTGLHLEQYRHATWSALDYYEEALRRDPMDVRCNNAVGLWYLRRARFDKAEPYFRTAVKVLQKRNLNPYDGEPIYNLALCLKYRAMEQGTQASQGKSLLDEAYDWAYKATWNAAWQQAGFLMCSQIATLRGDYSDALYLIDKSLIYGWHNHKARALKAALLSLLDSEAFDAFCAESLKINPFNYAILFEQGKTDEMKALMRKDSNNYDELALDYIASGLYDSALSIWEMAIEENAATALTYYYIAWITGNVDDLKRATRHSIDYCFPNRMEAAVALSAFPNDANANYLLGNLYYDKRQYDKAKECWERSEALNPTLPTVHRNLALLYYNKEHDADRALQEMEMAFTLDQSDARIFMELDQLYKKLNRPFAERLQNYEALPQIIAQRDDLVLEHATLLNQLGRYEEGKAIIDNHIFHPWEGGEGKVSGQYQLCRLEIAKKIIADVVAKEHKQQKDSDSFLLDATTTEENATTVPNITRAIQLLEECLVFPAYLGEGKLYGAQDNDFYYYLGRAFEAKGRELKRNGQDYESDRFFSKASKMFRLGTQGPTEPAAALYYNDAKPEKIYFAALCYRALGDEDKACSLFHKLVNYGKQHYFDSVRMDYFAVSLPDLLVWDEDLNLRNKKHCEMMIALGEKGLENE